MGHGLTHISCCTRFNQRSVGSLTKLVNMSSGVYYQLCLRQPIQLNPPALSRAFMTSPNPLIHSTSFVPSFTFPCLAWILIPDDGLKWRAVTAATRALDFEISGLRNRNCRFRLDKSIVSRSIWILAIPPQGYEEGSWQFQYWQIRLIRGSWLIHQYLSSARVEDSRSSQPIPPAPTTRILVFFTFSNVSAPSRACTDVDRAILVDPARLVCRYKWGMGRRKGN
jgi:hypothetical protein